MNLLMRNWDYKNTRPVHPVVDIRFVRRKANANRKGLQNEYSLQGSLRTGRVFWYTIGAV